MEDKETEDAYWDRVIAMRKKYHSDHFGDQSIGIAPDAMYDDRRKSQARAKREYLHWYVLHFGGNPWDDFKKRGVPSGLIGDCVSCHGTGHDTASLPTPRVPAQLCASCSGSGRISSDEHEKELRRAYMTAHAGVSKFQDIEGESLEDWKKRASAVTAHEPLGTPEGWFPEQQQVDDGSSEIASSYDVPFTSAWSILKNIA